jgi:hypothetical protein
VIKIGSLREKRSFIFLLDRKAGFSMAIRDIFKALSEMFEREKADYAVIGAFALYAYGYVRATRDIDFVTRIEFQKKAVSYLESLGFNTVHCSNAFSNHV